MGRVRVRSIEHTHLLPKYLRMCEYVCVCLCVYDRGRLNMCDCGREECLPVFLSPSSINQKGWLLCFPSSSSFFPSHLSSSMRCHLMWEFSSVRLMSLLGPPRVTAMTNVKLWVYIQRRTLTLYLARMGPTTDVFEKPLNPFCGWQMSIEGGGNLSQECTDNRSL